LRSGVDRQLVDLANIPPEYPTIEAGGGSTQFREELTRDDMVNVKNHPRLTSLAPQFLVDDLERSMAYYRKLGFAFGAPWDGFYAIGELDGLELHLKEAPKNVGDRQYRRDNEHLDAAAGVDGVEAFYERCVANGAMIRRPLSETGWGTKDFYIEDPDGYVIAFGGRPS
jgi:catechol 2,3-dioxygenase-like lactoylglutathione lyase family enzyme